MKRLLEQTEPSLGALTDLVASAEKLQLGPFAKRAMESRLQRALQTPSKRPLFFRPALFGAGALLIAATAAAAGYSFLSAPPSASSAAAVAPIAPPATVVVPPRQAPQPVEVPETPQADTPPAVEPSTSATVNKRAADKLAAGEDPTKVAEAVRALRKQGDAARAQQLLDQYLRSNPRGALAEDALALSIEAAAARKDPRAADYARRYLARYPNGRFRAVAERALSR